MDGWSDRDVLGHRTIASARNALAEGRVTAEALAEAAIQACAEGEGPRAALTVYRETALETARHTDRMRAIGADLPPLAGVPVTIKDLFAVKGEPTRAGSSLTADAAPAEADAPVIAYLKRAGAVIVAKTNMSEFAFSGVGINPHYDTPRNPYRRDEERIPGGSSSGAAISVTDGMAIAAVGTDTAGSVRVPATLCGLAGFKPSSGRHLMGGVVPLSPTLDTIGPLARSIACCRRMDAALAGARQGAGLARPIAGLRIGVPQTVVLDDLEPVVADAFQRALSRLSKAGAVIIDLPMREFGLAAEIAGLGNISPPEAWAYHRKTMTQRRDAYDPRVVKRIEGGRDVGAADYLDMLALRRRMRALTDVSTRLFDVLVHPTLPITAPRIAELETDEAFFATNGLLLRNTLIGNLLDRPIATLPIHAPDEPGIGLSILGETGGDGTLLDIAEGAETALAAPERARTPPHRGLLH
ncbi:MAG: amidase [Pseudomonadota bacterium]